MNHSAIINCRRKRRHKTEKKAKKAAGAVKRLRLASYHCKICGYWHITKRPAPSEEFIGQRIGKGLSVADGA